MSSTLTTHRDDDSQNHAEARAYLVVAMHAHDPLAPPSRHRLTGLDEVAIGRGDEHAARRTNGRLELALADRWISTRHARLHLAQHRWVIEDEGSRNGIFVNDARVKQLVLQDGDVIEVGHTFLVFRLGPDDGRADDVDATTLDAGEPGLATLCPELAVALDRLARVAASNESILVGGETGTGKELVARAIHARSGRRGDFVAVNCGALPEAIAEAELFGHRRGAFSGALHERVGYVRSAEGGTLFLDEVADLRQPSQAALLRVLQERQVVPLGAERPVEVDVRFCAATHHALDQLVDEERFRADLYARLRGFELTLPPLRDRREDLGLLVRAVLRQRGARTTISCAATRALFACAWPHNVRELVQALGSALALAGDAAIERSHLPASVAESELADGISGASSPSGERRPLVPAELDRRAELIRLLREHQGNIAAVGRVVGKGRQQIHRWLKRFELDPAEYRR